MAILCPELKLLFIQTPHTGCTAIGGRLREEFAGQRVPDESIRDARGRVIVQRKHATLRELMAGGLITPEQRRRLVVAAGVRNPFDMLASEYVRTTRGEQVGGRRSRVVEAGSRNSGRGQAPLDFEPWLRWRFATGLTERLRGSRYREARDFAEGVNSVIRFEHLQTDFEALLQRLGVMRRIEVPFVNPTVARHGQHYSTYYTPGARAIVEDVYGHWLRRFAYRFETAPRPRKAVQVTERELAASARR